MDIPDMLVPVVVDMFIFIPLLCAKPLPVSSAAVSVNLVKSVLFMWITSVFTVAAACKDRVKAHDPEGSPKSEQRRCDDDFPVVRAANVWFGHRGEKGAALGPVGGRTVVLAMEKHYCAWPCSSRLS
ncbi:hypothetical protein [Deinococcus ruber]|uniref:hypothetical protein n=1 Tax=Deinococcus ruber TaxID=1848197 RepID=UPI001E45278C|nr:hypothetical protein [Deinococcus ruber]